LSGTIQRLFKVLDTNKTGKINFTEFLRGALVFLRGSQEERRALAFRFCDLSENSRISRTDLTKAFAMLHEMYNGSPGKGDVAEREAAVFSLLLFQKAKSMRPSFSAVANNFFSPPSDDATAQEPRRKTRLTFCDTSPVLAQSSDPRTLNLREFGQVIALHPLAQLFFGLDTFPTGANEGRGPGPSYLSRQFQMLNSRDAAASSSTF
jgi:hypothetical protein